MKSRILDLAKDAGTTHRERLTEITKKLDGKSPISLDGMNRLVDLLGNRVFKKKGAELLKKLIKAIVEAVAMDALLEIVNALLKEAIEMLEDVAVAIISIARDSISYVKSFVSGLPTHVIVRIISADVQGALAGADVGEKLGGARGAVFGAIAGGVASSANAW